MRFCVCPFCAGDGICGPPNIILMVVKIGDGQRQMQGLKYLKPNIPNTSDVN